MFLTTVEIPDISVDIKSIKQMLDGFDPVSLLPSIDTLVGKVQLVCVIALLAGPLIMTGMGLVYLLFAPKEANYYLGYRTAWAAFPPGAKPRSWQGWCSAFWVVC